MQTHIEKLQKYNVPHWDQLPNLQLYMEQVITVINSLLGLFAEGEPSCGITSNMINNYVKAGYIKRPVNKKYDKEQLVQLYIIMILKTVIPISDAVYAMKKSVQEVGVQALYEEFSAIQKRSFSGVAERLIKDFSIQSGTEQEQMIYAMQLVTEAKLLRLAAEKVLSGTKKTSA